MNIVSYFSALISKKKLLANLGVFLGLCIGLSSCDSHNLERTKGRKASAILNPTKGNKAHGNIVFTNVEAGVLIVADIEGLTPGEHGFHIHEKGDCSAPDASSAGDHFNPTQKSHGGPIQANRHVGDLGNIVADDQGNAHYERVDEVVSLEGENSIVGRSVIVHENRDDLVSQPSGDAGKRLACGVIKVVE